MTTEQYVSVLNPEQKAAVMHEGSPLLILAGAGSGKTRVITTKIAYLIAEKNVRPQSILAVTFTKKAAKEMLDRAIQLEPDAERAQIRTFHSFGAWFLRVYAEQAGLDPNFTVYDDDDMVTLITKAIPDLPKKNANHIAHCISLAKDYCYEPDNPHLTDIDPSPEFPEYYEAYQKRLRETGNVDFGDLIMLPVLLLQQNERIRTQMQYRFRVILVDEYQDSNVAQFQLLSALAGPETYVCVVGDDDQSIYKFRGAEVQNILTFQDQFPGTTLIRLERNYRSVSPILHAADAVVSHNSDRLGKTLVAERGDGKKPVLAFIPTQDDEARFAVELIKAAHKKGVPYADWAILYRTNAQSLSFETLFNNKKLPYTIVGSLKFWEREEIKDALCWLSFIANPRDEIAFRRIVNKPARGIGDTSQNKILATPPLLAGDAGFGIDGIPSSASSLSEAGGAVSRGILDSCRAALPAMSAKAKKSLGEFIELIEKYQSELGMYEPRATGLESGEVPSSADSTDSAADASRSPMADLAAAASGEEKKADKNAPSLAGVLEELIKETGLIEYHTAQDEIAGTQRVANLQELCNSAIPYAPDRTGLLEYLDHVNLDRTLETENDEQVDAVTLITLHNTKGLEFPRVIITGLEEGIFPRAEKTAEELEEERRLFYVGITRAKDELYMTSCGVRRMYGRTEYMAISPFLKELDTQQIEVLGTVPSSFKRVMQAQKPASEKPEDNPDEYGYATEEDMELLERWRKGRTVFHDDYGYGQIISAKVNEDGEFIIEVQFQTGEKKKFLPKYQANRLMIAEI